MPKQARPAPVVVTTVCSMCGLDWQRHGSDPTTEDCIRLLKMELAHRPVTITLPVPYAQPVVYPTPVRPWPTGPTWTSNPPAITCDTATASIPRLSSTTCSAVAA